MQCMKNTEPDLHPKSYVIYLLILFWYNSIFILKHPCVFTDHFCKHIAALHGLMHHWCIGHANKEPNNDIPRCWLIAGVCSFMISEIE